MPPFQLDNHLFLLTYLIFYPAYRYVFRIVPLLKPKEFYVTTYSKMVENVDLSFLWHKTKRHKFIYINCNHSLSRQIAFTESLCRWKREYKRSLCKVLLRSWLFYSFSWKWIKCSKYCCQTYKKEKETKMGKRQKKI